MASAFEKTISVTKFKATCLDLMDQVNAGNLRQVTVTKRGKPYVTWVSQASTIVSDDWFTGIPKLINMSPGFDLTEPVIDLADIEALQDEDAL